MIILDVRRGGFGTGMVFSAKRWVDEYRRLTEAEDRERSKLAPGKPYLEDGPTYNMGDAR